MNSKKDDLSMSGFHTIQMAFYIWGYIMTTDLETLNKRYNGLTAFDDFYILLNNRNL
jgi:hypothetical protein